MRPIPWLWYHFCVNVSSLGEPTLEARDEIVHVSHVAGEWHNFCFYFAGPGDPRSEELIPSPCIDKEFTFDELVALCKRWDTTSVFCILLMYLQASNDVSQ